MKIQIPSLGESIVEATIGQIFKPTGSVVRADEELLEIETEKVNQMLYAPAAGTVKLSVKTGDRVKVGQSIGSIEEGSVKIKEETSEIRKNEAPKAKAVEPTAPGSENRKKMSSLRKAVANRLVEVKNETAMLTTFNEVDMTAVTEVREAAQEFFQKKYGVKLGFMPFFIQATASALKALPEVNGRIEGDEIVTSREIHIGIAVSTDRGLMVPVLRHVDKMTYGQIETALKALAEKARGGSLSLADLQGGTFTITNGGVFGSLLSTPILNPPQSGILGMHQIVKRPIAINNEVVIRPMMYLALSYDHRIVDGKEAITFLVHIKKMLEDPSQLRID